MRTPNTCCIICKKQLYRRPNELKMVKFVCCRDCRSEAYKKFPNKNSIDNLKLGREKGTNHLEGIPKSVESNKKRSKSHKLFWKNNPEKLKERGKKIRAEKHYRWKGGISNLNKAIRLLHENRKWSDNVKIRDNKCLKCGSNVNLEAHHIVEISILIKTNNIKTIDDARLCDSFWDITNGIALCKKCHYKHHNRRYNEN